MVFTCRMSLDNLIDREPIFPSTFTIVKEGLILMSEFAENSGKPLTRDTTKWKPSIAYPILIKEGTAIATFTSEGKFGNSLGGRTFAAFYQGYDVRGILVVWTNPNTGRVESRAFNLSTPEAKSFRIINV